MSAVLPPIPTAAFPPPLATTRPDRRFPTAEPNATLLARHDLTGELASFVVAPDDPAAAHLPGQYATLGLVIDGVPVSRPYSMASLPGGAWEFHVRRVRDGHFTRQLFALPAGARLHLGAAKGRFTLDPGDRRPHLFLATGTGIAPFVAMIRAARASGDPRPFTVVHGAAYADELGYRAYLLSLEADGAPLRYRPTVSRPSDPRSRGWSGATGRAEDLLDRAWPELVPDPADVVAWLCGNPGMVAAAEARLLARGVPAVSIRREAYWLPARA